MEEKQTHVGLQSLEDYPRPVLFPQSQPGYIRIQVY